MIVDIIALCFISTVVGCALVCTHLENKKYIRLTIILCIILILLMLAYGMFAIEYQYHIGEMLGIPKWAENLTHR